MSSGVVLWLSFVSCETYVTFLHAFLQPSVDVKTVLARLMERLSNYAASGAEVSNVYFHKYWCEICTS